MNERIEELNNTRQKCGQPKGGGRESVADCICLQIQEIVFCLVSIYTPFRLSKFDYKFILLGFFLNHLIVLAAL